MSREKAEIRRKNIASECEGPFSETESQGKKRSSNGNKGVEGQDPDLAQPHLNARKAAKHEGAYREQSC